MIFKKAFTTKWHDTDARRQVRPTQMLVYMQEVSNLHMESCGMSLDRLRDERGLAFILSKIRLKLYRPLYAYEQIEVQTWTCEGRGFAISRFYRIVRGDEIIADADTTWALIDINSRSLVRGDQLDVYNFENEPLPDLDLPARIRFPKDVPSECLGKRRIVYSDLDYNMHMNNTRYPDMLCDFMPLDEINSIKGFVLSYVNEGTYGDLLDVLSVKQDNVRYFRTQSSNGNTCLEAAVVM